MRGVEILAMRGMGIWRYERQGSDDLRGGNLTLRRVEI